MVANPNRKCEFLKRNAVDIDLHIAGSVSRVLDTFEVDDGQIRRLTIEGLRDDVTATLRAATGRD